MEICSVPSMMEIAARKAVPTAAKIMCSIQRFVCYAVADLGGARSAEDTETYKLQPRCEFLEEPQFRCICAGQGGSVYPSECPRHDPSVDTSDPKDRHTSWAQFSRRELLAALVPDLADRVEALEAEVKTLRQLRRCPRCASMNTRVMLHEEDPIIVCDDCRYGT